MFSFAARNGSKTSNISTNCDGTGRVSVSPKDHCSISNLNIVMSSGHLVIQNKNSDGECVGCSLETDESLSVEMIGLENLKITIQNKMATITNN